MIRSIALFLLLGLAAALPAFATPETYVVDGAHSFPRFSYSHFGYSTQLNRFDKTTGSTIKRSDFNAGKYAPYVSDGVRIDIALEAIKE
jgi:polyisoprenoid-binding protein YceI